ncbi:MAG: MoxR family ATPase [Cyclobacteriaceae bacterium]
MEENIKESEITQNPLLGEFNKLVEQTKQEVGKVIIGQSRAVELFLVSLFTGGHVLLEGVPGIAKTLTAKLLSKTVDSGFSRVQFTPDLMPTDIIGTSIFNLKESEFSFKPGPIFSNIVLIDEVNRAPAKTQAALFEVMEEKQISVDGKTYNMEFPFMVIATQNPIEQEGTYKLPEAQLDRFLFKIKMDYPSLENEKLILRKFKNDFGAEVVEEVKKVIKPKQILEFKKLIEGIHIKEELIDYIAEIIHITRNTGELFLGASPRASLAILKASKAISAMRGRDFVTPEDIKYVLVPILNHRVILSAEREMEGTEIEDVIDNIINSVEVPR